MPSQRAGPLKSEIVAAESPSPYKGALFQDCTFEVSKKLTVWRTVWLKRIVWAADEKQEFWRHSNRLLEPVPMQQCLQLVEHNARSSALLINEPSA